MYHDAKLLRLKGNFSRDVIEGQRGKHPEFVFIYKGKPITHMTNNGWCKARKLSGLPCVCMILNVPLVDD